MPDIKTANALYNEHKAGGGKLSFTEFLDAEKNKMFNATGETTTISMYNKSLNDSIGNAINKTLAQGGLKTQVSGQTVLGINKTVFIGGAIVITALTIFLIVKNNKK